MRKSVVESEPRLLSNIVKSRRRRGGERSLTGEELSDIHERNVTCLSRSLARLPQEPSLRHRLLGRRVNG